MIIYFIIFSYILFAMLGIHKEFYPDISELQKGVKVEVTKGYHKGKKGKVIDYIPYTVVSSGGLLNDTIYKPEQVKVKLQTEDTVWLEPNELKLVK